MRSALPTKHCSLHRFYRGIVSQRRRKWAVVAAALLASVAVLRAAGIGTGPTAAARRRGGVRIATDGIPNLVHQTWKISEPEEELPGWVRQSGASWRTQNPAHTHML